MNKYLELFRLENAIIGVVGLIVSSFIVADTLIGHYWSNILIACIIVIFFIAGGNAINDYVDREIDKTAHPKRPIPSGRLTPKKALYVGSACLIISCVLSLFLINWSKEINFENLRSTLIVVVAVVLMVLYETLLKQRGFIGNIVIALLTGMVFLLGGSVLVGGIVTFNTIVRCYYVAGMAALVTVGREIAKDIEDVDSDKGRKTLPMQIGTWGASVVAAIFFIAGPALSILPMAMHLFNLLYFTVLVADAIFIYAATILFRNPHESQRLAKFGMIVALISFVLGALPWLQ